MDFPNKSKIIIALLAGAGLIAALALFYFRFSGGDSVQSKWRLADPSMLGNPNISRFVSQIVFRPGDPKTLYVTVAGQGVFKSTDGGESWEPLNEGLKSVVIFQLIIDPSRPDTLYLGTAGAGLYRSEDGGRSWAEANQGLTNASIEGLLISPARPDTLYAASTGGGLFKSEDRGRNWLEFNQGLPSWDTNNFQSFLFVSPTDPNRLFFANSKGLFERTDSSSPDAPRTIWREIDLKLKGKAVSYFFYQPLHKLFYLVTQTGEIFKSPDAVKWNFVSDGLKGFAVYSVAFGSNRPDEFFVAGGLGGVLHSADRGLTWKPTIEPPPGHDVRNLAIDPNDPQRMFIGARDSGLWISNDGGRQWMTVSSFPILDWAYLMEAIQPPRHPPGDQADQAGIPPPTAGFDKCNSCHGWTDSTLNSNWHSLWYVAPTPRDWGPTVERMKDRSELTPKEAEELTAYLNRHFGKTQTNIPTN